MPLDLVFGFETEWMSFSKRAAPEEAARCALAALQARVPNLPVHNASGIFLENSSRCYLDCGHLETSTAEVNDPLHLVACVKAMERILMDISRPASQLLGGGAAIKFGRANVDPSSGATYGQHESFLSAHPNEFYAKDLLPFLVTRPAWSGAGGLVPTGGGVDFAVAPRLLLFSSISGSGSTSDRPILHIRNEPLASSGSHRVHIIAGETLSSEQGLYLKAGVTALVVRAIDLGGHIRMEIDNPLASLHIVARDPRCKEMIRLSDGRRLTAVQIQFAYLALVEKHLDDMPAWAPAVCRRWRTTLAALAEDPMLLGRTLDWPIKYNLWNAYVHKLERDSKRKGLLAALREAAGNTACQANARHSRAKLSEILDVRFGILGEGIFDMLDRQGVLQHRMLEVESIEQAMMEAPPGTRARLRSQAIKEMAGRREGACAWEFVFDGERGVLDLGDPRAQSAEWRKPRLHELPPARRPRRDQIVALAFQLWQERGCPEGDQQADWYRAEQRLREEGSAF
ncbi:MAG TPA: proteasome accessory factor PafA2 family protein [Methylomirabilota bacterium]|nr:proteasome accessory factor PafA2 family protein [Methylomirabilota bacterium]